MNEDSWKGSVFTLWKVNPLILVLILAMTYVGNQVLFQSTNHDDKMFFLGLAAFFILVAIVFEVFRI